MSAPQEALPQVTLWSRQGLIHWGLAGGSGDDHLPDPRSLGYGSYLAAALGARSVLGPVVICGDYHAPDRRALRLIGFTVRRPASAAHDSPSAMIGSLHRRIARHGLMPLPEFREEIARIIRRVQGDPQ